MSISRNSISPFVNHFASAVQPAGGTILANQGLIYLTGEYIGSDSVATPAGWSDIGDTTHTPQMRAFGKIAAGGDTIPSVTWASQFGWAILLNYSGLDLSLTAGFSALGRATNNAGNIVGGLATRTPSAAGAGVWAVGMKNKTSTSDSSSFSAPPGFTVIASQVIAGTRQAVVVCEQIQGTPNAITNPAITGTVADGTAQAGNFVLFSILAAGSVFAPYPSRRNQTTYEPVYLYN